MIDSFGVHQLKARRGQRSWAERGARFAASALLIVFAGPLTSLWAGADASQGEEVEGGLSLIGKVALHDAEGSGVDVQGLALDNSARMLIGSRFSRLYLANLDPPFQQVGIRESGVAGVTALAIDEETQRVFAVGTIGRMPAIGTTKPTGDPTTYTFPASYSSHSAIAAFYSPAEHRLYVLTQLFGVAVDTPKNVAIHAVDATLLESTDPVQRSQALIWSYPLSECHAVPGSSVQPAFLGRGADGFLYFFCSGSDTASPGAVRLNLILGSQETDTSKFTVEFFPIASELTDGFATGDPKGERLVIASSRAGLQKLFVFDARHRSWTGSVPLTQVNVRGGAVNQATGRLFITQEHIGILVTEGASLPVPQGETQALNDENGAEAPVLIAHPIVDSVTDRLFVPVSTLDASLFVYEDRTPQIEPPAREDPDDGTHPPEILGRTPISFSGSASAFGAREIFVGGRRAATGSIGDVDPSGTEQNYFSWVKRALLDTTVSRVSAIRSEYQNNDGNLNPPAASTISECRDPPSETQDKQAANPGSSVSCDLDNLITSGNATASQDSSPSQSPVGVSESYSTVSLKKDPDLGMVAEGTAVARGISIGGLISIGEVRVVAKATAKGGPEPAHSEFETTIKDFVSVGGLSCGVGNDNGVAGQPCDSNAVAAEINRVFQGRIQAQVPRRDLTEDVQGSDGGAQALVIRDPYYFWSEKNVNDDDQQEVPGLQLTIYNDQREASRQVIQLAAVLLEAHYLIGSAGEDGTLTVQLTDTSTPPDLLAGGKFEVYSDENENGRVDDLTDELVEDRACLTSEDGIGDCRWRNLLPGKYLIRQTKAPEGYFPYPDDFSVEIAPAGTVTVIFQNLPPVGLLRLDLSDDSKPPVPLAGGTFELNADDGDESSGEKVATCTTEENGECLFESAEIGGRAFGVAKCTDSEEDTECIFDPDYTEGNAILVPLGAYTADQTSAPAGYLTADPLTGELKRPFDIGTLSFTNGREGEAGTASGTGSGTAGTPGTPAGTFVVEPGTTAVQPTVAGAPIQPNLLLRILRLPGEAIKFLLRHPVEAILLALVWLMFGLPLWMARRRRLGWLVAQATSIL